jgi:transcriptional regulator with XRE-family HTH domain
MAMPVAGLRPDSHTAAVQWSLTYCAQYLRRIRKRQGLTQQAVGALIGVKGNAVSTFEKGHTLLPLDKLLLLARVLEVPATLLFPASPQSPEARLLALLAQRPPALLDTLVHMLEIETPVAPCPLHRPGAP